MNDIARNIDRHPHSRDSFAAFDLAAVPGIAFEACLSIRWLGGESLERAGVVLNTHLPCLVHDICWQLA